MSKNGFFKQRLCNYWRQDIPWCSGGQKGRDNDAKRRFKTVERESRGTKPEKFSQVSFLSDGEFGVVTKYDNFDLSGSLSDYWGGVQEGLASVSDQPEEET